MSTADRVTNDSSICENVVRGECCQSSSSSSEFKEGNGSDDHALHRCITQFMLDTCGSDTTRSYCALAACLVRSMAMGVSKCEVLSSGSSAEFYIKPMLPYLGDIDIMSCFNSRLAIPEGQTPPAELPAHFLPSVIVYEIIASNQPGFVYLRSSYLLARNESGSYVVEKRISSGDTPQYLPKTDIDADSKLIADKSRFRYQLERKVHGPALQTGSNWTVINTPSRYCIYNEFFGDVNTEKKLWYFDYVLCVRCRCWPPQAADWPKRNRDHDVPEKTCVDMVVSNGCDLVGAVHPRCKQDEWMNKHQWRLSFSRAEVTLLNSWTRVQQNIYHMLRFVLKREILSKTNDSDIDLPTLNNYYIKVLMLWECELKSQSWWSAESSFIELCRLLLHKLSDWVRDKHCQHYFISNCNLFDHFEDASLTICHDLRRLADSSFLLTWFVNNYIHECAQLCPREVSALFENVPSNGTLEKAIRAVANWKVETKPAELLHECQRCERSILNNLQLFDKRTVLAHLDMKELLNFDLRLRDYCVAVIYLAVAYPISTHSLTEDLLGILWSIFVAANATDSDRAINRIESGKRAYMCIEKAIKLATLTNSGSDASEMLHNEMSKAYLHHSFVHGEESTYCAVHVLLAVLYYKSGHYQSAMDHCKQVLNLRDSGHGSPRIGAEYLPQIDGSVDAVIGLILLYQHIWRHSVIEILQLQSSHYVHTHDTERASPRTPAMHTGVQAAGDGQEPVSSSSKAAAEPYHIRAFTTHLLARYLQSVSSALITAPVGEAKLYQRDLVHTKQPLLSDVLLFRLMKMQQCECTESEVKEDGTRGAGNNASGTMDTTLVVTMLELVALENLARARQVMVRELHCERFPVVNEFEALYAYKCGLFEQCIEICRRYISMLRADSVGLQRYFISFPEMLSLLDGEVVSVVGIIHLLGSTLADYLMFLEHCKIDVLTLLLYLIVQCQKHLLYNSVHDTMKYIIHVHDTVYPANLDYIFDRLILKLTYRSLRLFVESRSDLQPSVCPTSAVTFAL